MYGGRLLKILMAYLTDVFLSFQVEFFHTPTIIWDTLLPTMNSTSTISSSAKSGNSLKTRAM